MWRCLGHTEMVMVGLVISSLVALICTMRHALMKALSLERICSLLVSSTSSIYGAVLQSIFCERPESSGSGQSTRNCWKLHAVVYRADQCPILGMHCRKGWWKTMCMYATQFSWNIEGKGCRNIGVAWFWCNWRTGEVRLLTIGDVPSEHRSMWNLNARKSCKKIIWILLSSRLRFWWLK